MNSSGSSSTHVKEPFVPLNVVPGNPELGQPLIGIDAMLSSDVSTTRRVEQNVSFKL